ncbi:MAG: 7-cyano-7-deazaguanine synthase QueC [Candidatus Omnitrophota bacterium]
MKKKKKKKAVVLLSGGLDSTTTLYDAKAKGYRVRALIFDYGQRHKKEVRQAEKIARLARCEYRVIKLPFSWKGSALLDGKMSLPRGRNLKTISKKKIPSTYVPARNIVFLSIAASVAESWGARKIFIGANARDYSGYPDCRPEFFRAFAAVLTRGTKSGVEHKAIKIETPLIHKTKEQIIRMGRRLGVPYQLTWSCYRGGQRPCGTCDSCLLRQKGFAQLNLKDPVLT